MKKFKLTLGFEEFKTTSFTKDKGFTSIEVQLDDGRNYELFAWTFGFDEVYRQQLATNMKSNDPQYLIPPDILVKELTRECIEKTIEDLLDQGDLEMVLKIGERAYA